MFKVHIRAPTAEATAELAQGCIEYIKGRAAEVLNTRLRLYLDALTYNLIGPNYAEVVLANAADWIENGLPRHSMVDDLLKARNAKTAKDGSRYAVIPIGGDFRVVSSKHIAAGKWVFPGINGVHIMRDAQNWVDARAEQ